MIFKDIHAGGCFPTSYIIVINDNGFWKHSLESCLFLRPAKDWPSMGFNLVCRDFCRVSESSIMYRRQWNVQIHCNLTLRSVIFKLLHCLPAQSFTVGNPVPMFTVLQKDSLRCSFCVPNHATNPLSVNLINCEEVHQAFSFSILQLVLSFFFCHIPNFLQHVLLTSNLKENYTHQEKLKAFRHIDMVKMICWRSDIRMGKNVNMNLREMFPTPCGIYTTKN